MIGGERLKLAEMLVKSFLQIQKKFNPRNKNDYFQTNKDWIGENHIINNSYFMDSLFTSHIRTAKDFYQTIVCGKYEDATHRDNCQFYYDHLRDKEEWFQDQTDLEINVWLYLDGNHKT